MTKLDKPLKREFTIDGKPYGLTIESRGFKLVLKGHRKGLEFAWRDLVSGGGACCGAQRLPAPADLTTRRRQGTK